MSPSRSAFANAVDLAWARVRLAPERSRCLRRALVHARQMRASPSGDLADALNADADSRFSQAGQLFVAIIVEE
jgi:hypothetical protein